uniref:Uncharacterized protein n=1 Tax=Neospora caninum (strain Liverpool) TaxID=572307 RepID=A0A0F7UII5_NEOCL|nr:TPA: hypothetical protein BN1204_055780 [Neospora caninum Liverpool]
MGQKRAQCGWIREFTEHLLLLEIRDRLLLEAEQALSSEDEQEGCGRTKEPKDGGKGKEGASEETEATTQTGHKERDGESRRAEEEKGNSERETKKANQENALPSTASTRERESPPTPPRASPSGGTSHMQRRILDSSSADSWPALFSTSSSICLTPTSSPSVPAQTTPSLSSSSPSCSSSVFLSRSKCRELRMAQLSADLRRIEFLPCRLLAVEKHKERADVLLLLLTDGISTSLAALRPPSSSRAILPSSSPRPCAASSGSVVSPSARRADSPAPSVSPCSTNSCSPPYTSLSSHAGSGSLPSSSRKAQGRRTRRSCGRRRRREASRSSFSSSPCVPPDRRGEKDGARRGEEEPDAGDAETLEDRNKGDRGAEGKAKGDRNEDPREAREEREKFSRDEQVTNRSLVGARCSNDSVVQRTAGGRQETRQTETEELWSVLIEQNWVGTGAPWDWCTSQDIDDLLVKMQNLTSSFVEVRPVPRLAFWLASPSLPCLLLSSVYPLVSVPRHPGTLPPRLALSPSLSSAQAPTYSFVSSLFLPQSSCVSTVPASRQRRADLCSLLDSCQSPCPSPSAPRLECSPAFSPSRPSSFLPQPKIASPTRPLFASIASSSAQATADKCAPLASSGVSREQRGCSRAVLASVASLSSVGSRSARSGMPRRNVRRVGCGEARGDEAKGAATGEEGTALFRGGERRCPEGKVSCGEPRRTQEGKERGDATAPEKETDGTRACRGDRNPGNEEENPSRKEEKSRKREEEKGGVGAPEIVDLCEDEPSFSMEGRDSDERNQGNSVREKPANSRRPRPRENGVEQRPEGVQGRNQIAGEILTKKRRSQQTERRGSGSDAARQVGSGVSAFRSPGSPDASSAQTGPWTTNGAGERPRRARTPLGPNATSQSSSLASKKTVSVSSASSSSTVPVPPPVSPSSSSQSSSASPSSCLSPLFAASASLKDVPAMGVHQGRSCSGFSSCISLLEESLNSKGITDEREHKRVKKHQSVSVYVVDDSETVETQHKSDCGKEQQRERGSAFSPKFGCIDTSGFEGTRRDQRFANTSFSPQALFQALRSANRGTINMEMLEKFRNEASSVSPVLRQMKETNARLARAVQLIRERRQKGATQSSQE